MMSDDRQSVSGFRFIDTVSHASGFKEKPSNEIQLVFLRIHGRDETYIGRHLTDVFYLTLIHKGRGTDGVVPIKNDHFVLAV